MTDRFGGGGPFGPDGPSLDSSRGQGGLNSGGLSGPGDSEQGIKELQVDIDGYYKGASPNSTRNEAEESKPSATPKEQAALLVDPKGDLLRHVTTLEYVYSILGLVLGLCTIVGGIVLGLRGVTGSTSWTAKALGLQSTINDAAPGVVLFIVGVFLVFITRPKIHFRNIQQ